MNDSGTKTQNFHRLDGVDMLRGLAIFLVLMNHVNMRLTIAEISYGMQLPQQLLHSLVWSGQYGVQIFFSISGFLITLTSMQRWGTPSLVKPTSFYWLRFARIAPLLILLLVVLSLLHLTRLHWFYVSPAVGGLARALWAALTFHVNLLEAQSGYLPGNWDILWSLSVEETFYLAFPLACVWLGRGKLLYGLLVTLVIMGPFARTIWAHGNETWAEYSYLGGMDAIALGCLTALCLPRLKFSRRRLLTILTVGGAGVFFILGFSLRTEAWGLVNLGLDMTAISLGTCLVIAAFSQLKKSWVIASPLVWIGRRSYEIYMTHMFVVIGVFALFQFQGAPVGAIPLLFMLTIPIAAILGEIVARLYSEPMYRYLRRQLSVTTNH